MTTCHRWGVSSYCKLLIGLDPPAHMLLLPSPSHHFWYFYIHWRTWWSWLRSVKHFEEGSPERVVSYIFLQKVKWLFPNPQWFARLVVTRCRWELTVRQRWPGNGFGRSSSYKKVAGIKLHLEWNNSWNKRAAEEKELRNTKAKIIGCLELLNSLAESSPGRYQRRIEEHK